MATKHVTDDSAFARHTGALPIGRVRPATLDEDMKRETLFRPDAVLALTRALGGPGAPALPPFEAHVASLVDGVRPVARIRAKSGVSSADLRIALASLADLGLLRVAGIVEETKAPLSREELPDADGSMSRVRPDVIPPHVMAEIAAMMEEDE